MQLEKRQNDGFFEPDDDLGFWQTNVRVHSDETRSQQHLATKY